MKFPYRMLLDLADTSLSPREVADTLTMLGLEEECSEEVEGDTVIDIKVLANRGDTASVLGVAREVLAKDEAAKPTALYSRLTASESQLDEDSAQIRSKTSVEIQTEDCQRYACRVFEGVKNGDSPDWVQQRLRQVGMRPISLLVDLTNYVMLETGQPLHAFDLDKLSGPKIVVRKAEKGEVLVTLDETEHELRQDQMMICDAERPVAAAGIMGGLETEVSESTERMLLESAAFLNTSVRRTRKQLGLNTEASYRFERYVDPDGVVAALNRFAELYKEITGDDPVPGVIDQYPQAPVRPEVTVRIARAQKILGMAVSMEEARKYLERLGFEIKAEGRDSLTVVAPSWRPDILREDDLIEEIGRVHGYEKIPDKLPEGVTTQGGTHGFDAVVEKVEEAALRAGLNQIVSHTLREQHPLDRPGERVTVRNPSSPEARYLRNSLLPSLADAALRNHEADALHLFEIGHVFSPDEKIDLGILLSGKLAPPHWSAGDQDTSDFFALKGVIQYVLETSSLRLKLEPPAEADKRFHPTRHAVLKHGEETVGVFGQVHPSLAKQLGLATESLFGELCLTAAASKDLHDSPHREISRFPAVRRDIAVVIEKSVPYAKIESAVEEAAGEVLEKQWLFDVYEGKGIAESQHSLAIALQLRKPHETFTDEEANRVRDAVVQALEALGGQLR